MSDDSLEDMPEFDKPENIPLIIPDNTPTEPLPVKRQCAEKNKEGNPCRVHPLKDSQYCLGHAKRLKLWKHTPTGIPRLRAPRGNTQGVKTREQILSMLSHRLDLVNERFGEICNPEVEEMICNICRTMAVVMKIEASEDVKIKGWRMAGSQ